jgi:group I intron endonuclease
MEINIENLKTSIRDTIKHDFIENNNFNLKDDLNNGQIYIIINKTNGKMYIGQATCYVGKNNNSWGSIGRWKSHLREAIKNTDDHCVLLNNAIRKYGEHNFEIITLFKGNINEINEKEEYYIKILNSLTPNGYNLKTGGDKGKDSDETKQKKKEAHTGMEHSEKTKESISKGQIGNRRNSMARKNEEDNILPKYIYASRTNETITRYSISGFPIGIDKAEYYKDVSFSVSKYGSKEKALEETITFLDELKGKYKYIDEEITNIKTTKNELLATEKKENTIKSRLPEYIYPIILENKIAGYYVKGVKDNKGIEYPKRVFDKKTNRWNLDEANKFVDILHYINKNNVDMFRFDIEEIDVNSIECSFYENYYLPQYVNILRKKGEIKGFCVNGFPDKKYKDGKYKKEFITLDKRSGIEKTFDEIYTEVIDHLNELKINLNSVV